MKQYKIANIIFLTLVGVILLAVGSFVLSKTSKTVSGLCIGIGAGLIGMNVSNLIIGLYYRKHPDIKSRVTLTPMMNAIFQLTRKQRQKSLTLP